MAYQQYFGRFSATDTFTNFGLNVNTLNLNTGSYYVRGYDSESTEQLVEAVEGQIRTVGGQGNANVTFNATTRGVTIDLNVPTNITFDHSSIGRALGFTDSDSTNMGVAESASYTSDANARYVWSPSRDLSDYPGDVNQWWTPQSTSFATRSRDGTVYSAEGFLLYDGRYSYSHLAKDEVIAANATHYDSFEGFWKDILHRGEPVRVYPNRDATSSTDYHTGIFAPGDEEYGPFSEFRQRHIGVYNGLWEVEFSMWKYN